MKTLLKAIYFLSTLSSKKNLKAIPRLKKYFFFNEVQLRPKSIHFLLSCILFSSALLFSTHKTNANNERSQSVDSLQSILKVAKEDINKVDILNELSFVSRKKSVENSIQFAEEALKLSQNLSYKKGITKSLTNLGFSYRLSNNFEKAIEYH
ncbi:MAG: hypothetical protein K8R85_05375, partial [Bacteroidetes bacterium]|nr:hypothetical protein [Bacteroidota bacterium]